MKHRLISLLLALMLLCTGMASAEGVTNAQKVLAKEGAEAFWELVTPKYASSLYIEEGYSNLTIWSPDGPAFPSGETYGTINPQVHYTVQMQETNGTGFTIEQVLTFVCMPWGDFSQQDVSADVLADGPIHIPAYGSFSYGSGSPRSGNMRYEIVVVAGTDDNGHALEFYGIFERLNVYSEDPENTAAEAANPDYDTQNLRYDAVYEQPVANNVWWVPAASLGQSSYRNIDIAAMVETSPEEKQENLSTLYEALQLFQISNFYNGNDNVRIMEKDIDWEHHKPGYHAVRTNTGCCATDSNWLNYILRDDYEEVGFIAYSQSDGSGHIFNYIYHEGYYYFIDLTHYRTDFLESSAPETGKMADYRASDFIAGNIHKAATPEDYIQYCVDSFNDPPELFFMYQADDCLPVTGLHSGDKVTITYPNNVDITVYDQHSRGTLDYQFVKPPKKDHDWEDIPSAEFVVDACYLTEGSTEDAAPVELSSYAPGDVLTLEDYGEMGFATIDGRDYDVAWGQNCGCSFEDLIFLHGGNRKSYFRYELPVDSHPALQDMQSVRIGELMIDVHNDIENFEIIRCSQAGDTLIVQEVNRSFHHDFEPIYMYKDDSGSWQALEPVWYLFHYELNGETVYEFSRVGCGVIQ